MNWIKIALVAIALNVVFGAGVVIGSVNMNSMWVDNSIEQGCAHYDSQTGEFTWNDEEKK